MCRKSMLAYALLLTWNLEPPCGSVSLQSERGRRGGGREGGEGGREGREGGGEGGREGREGGGGGREGGGREGGRGGREGGCNTSGFHA